MRAISPIDEEVDSAITDRTRHLDSYLHDSCQNQRDNPSTNQPPPFDFDEYIQPQANILSEIIETQHPLALAPQDLSRQNIPQKLQRITSPDYVTSHGLRQLPEDLAIGNSVTGKSYVEEIWSLSRVVDYEWIERCSRSMTLSAQNINLAQPALCERGFFALQRCFKGDLIQSFQNIIALIHVACAIAYHLHQHEDAYRWDEFFQDLCQVSASQSSFRFVRSFLQVVQCFCSLHELFDMFQSNLDLIFLAMCLVRGTQS